MSQNRAKTGRREKPTKRRREEERGQKKKKREKRREKDLNLSLFKTKGICLIIRSLVF